ncbi:molybdenum cofactor cytidylyltransferase [Vibrio sp. SS-MA-C1-2]|uniref:molybdenum cofactor cytidylyltransferase n=1 Tax=Vibrio sp. SS-MA-C1-2 TaxID=2908646 RepID=UPI001F46D4FD|nr:molybdenum cofactor cytidylyltransferase [Vibrio sp. SS-MA-C1-2]UJF18339.1 molybdenum cofactor cytidylyltransferase [Vibrio sp. SS-MA-C1-2]
MTTKQYDIDCVMPAAGLSSRMGDWKMMLPYKEGTILDISIDNALTFCRRVILVAGFNAEQLIERYQDRAEILVVTNETYLSGMFSSIQRGVAEVETEHFFIAHGDLPCLTYHIYEQMWQQRGDEVVMPIYGDKNGHPVIFPNKWRSVLLSQPLDSKMKKLVMSSNPTFVTLESAEILHDIDTPDAYQTLLKQR